MRCIRCGGSILGGKCLSCNRPVSSDDMIAAIASKLGFKGDLNELALGFKEEYKEHAKTLKDDVAMIASIAIDHLNEDPHYYTKAAKRDAHKLKIKSYETY